MTWLGGLALVATGIFWLSCVLAPIVAVLSHAGGLQGILDPILLSITSMTFKQALLSTAISGGVGLFLGVWVGRKQGRVAQVLLSLPYGVPSVVVGLAWVAWLGRSGILAGWGLRLDWSYSLKAVILAHSFLNIPYVALLVAQSMATLPERRLEAARTLGAGRRARLWLVVWPHVRWAFFSACAQVMALCAMSFALVLVLGGGPPVETLETALFARIRYGSVDLTGAAGCAFWEMAITLLPWLCVMALRSFKPEEDSAELNGARPRARSISGASLVVCGALMVPYLAVFRPELFKLCLNRGFLAALAHPFRISLALASATSVGALVLASFSLIALDSLKAFPKLRATLGTLLAVPSGVSVLVLGLGIWLAYGRWIDPFAGSFGAMLAVQVTLFFPLAYRMLWPAAQQIQRRCLEAAATLGASPWSAFWQVEWPRLKGPAFSVLGLVAGAALGEVAAVSLFYSENLIPMPLLITRWMGQYRFDEAQALAALLLVLSTGTIAMVSLARRE